MTALVQALSRFTHTETTDSGALKTLALFCGVGLFVSLLCMSYGFDLSAGSF